MENQGGLLLLKTKLEPFLREIVFLFLSLLFAGTIYVIPQTFLLKYYPEDKNTLLTFLIIAGTIAAILGVWMSNGRRINKALCHRRYSTVLLLIALTILFNLLYFIHTIALFICVLAAVKFISNLVYNYLDTSFSGSSGEHGLKQHVKAVLLYQLLAYILAPVYFSVFFFKAPFNVIGISLVSIFSIVFILKAKGIAAATAANPVKAREDRLDRVERSFLAYSMLIQVGMMIISSLAIFILRDYYFYEDAVLKGGILVGYISFISVAAIFATAFYRKRSDKKSDAKGIVLPTATNYAAAALFFISALLLLARLSHAFAYLLVIGTLTGAAYGLYLHSTRTYANMKASREHKTRVLVHYNNLPNIGTLISLSLVYIFTQISGRMGVDFNKTILVVVLCLYLFCAAAVANYSVQQKKVFMEEIE